MKRFNKIAFFTDVGYFPHPGQLLVHNSTARLRILVCGVRWGKTWCAAMEALAAALEPRDDSKGWIVAPTYDLANRVFRQMISVTITHFPHLIVTCRESDHLLVLRNTGGGRSEVRPKSADNPKSLIGEGLDWVIIDEAAQLKPDIWQSRISQRLLDRKGWALIITTPSGKGWVYDLYRRGQSGDPSCESWNAPTSQNPMLDVALIEAERANLPERVFRQEYLAEFVDGAGAVFHSVRECATGSFAEPIAGHVYFAGLDLGRSEDYSVLVILNREREIVFVDRFNGLDWAIQVNRVRAATGRYNRARILVDSTGAGQPIFEALRRAGCRVEGYTFTPHSKAALITSLSLMIEQRKLVLPKPAVWPEGIDELESYEFKMTEAGGIVMRAPYGYHDDCVVALALAAWQVRKPYVRPQIIFCDTWEEVQRFNRIMR
jgi:hypothetical protein